jgi:HK97 family phage portal protein
MGFMDYLEKTKEIRGILPTTYSGDLSGIDTLSLFNYTSNTGALINERTALELTPVSAAVRIIAESIASLPFCVYKRGKDNIKELAYQHPLYSILHDAPNPYFTSFTFWETVVSHMLLWGNAYAEIEWGPDGQVKALWLLRPDLTRPIVNDQGGIYYESVIGGDTVQLPFYRVLHIYGLGFNGIMGYSPIRLYREAIGLAKATEKYGAKYFGNGAKPGGVLEHPGQLSKDAQDRLKAGWNEMHQGLDNAHRVTVLEEGMSYKQIGLPPEDSQFLETRKFQVAEISRIFRVPLHMLSELDRSTNNNIEHQSIEFLTYTLTPWLTRIEQAISLKLMTAKERQKFTAEHIVDIMLRGDIKTRYEAYQTAHQNGWMSADDIREKEGMNPIPDNLGKVYMVNTAMQPISNLLNANVAAAGPVEGGDGGDEQGTTISADQGGTASQ